MDAFATHATVIVLQTPMFAERDTHSKILQYVRKGEQVYLRERDLPPVPESKDYEIPDVSGYEIYPPLDAKPENGFFETLTRTGKTAFIQAAHLKVIYMDEREQFTSITPFKHDPTDYRVPEPLPPKYPLFDPNHYRMALSWSFGPQRKINYPYPTFITHEDFKPRSGLHAIYVKKVSWDPYDRFYFGMMGFIFDSTSTFTLKSGASSTENQKTISLGPYFSYDTFRIKWLTLSFSGGLTFNYQNMNIAMSADSTKEERDFSGYTITPRLGSNLQLKDVLPRTDLVFGGELQALFPYSLSANTPAENPTLWNQDQDSVTFETGAIFSFYLGLQATY